MAGRLHLLIPLLLAASASAQVLLSIDCGGSEAYTDAKGIKWVGDGPYVQRGEAHSVQNTSGVPRELATLREFTSRKKNCYTIPVNPGGGEMQILLRASFYYGNYDGKATPPAFDLLFDGNTWGTVETTAGDVVFTTEAIYSIYGEATSLCVAQTKPGQFPFISAIEVRRLDQTMYANFDSTRWLSVWDRLAFGAAELIGYPDDPYDRTWRQLSLASGDGELTVLKNQSVIVVPADVEERPPAAVFEAAIASRNTSLTISLTPNLPSVSKDMNIYLYFAEMELVGLADTRIVEVTMDGVLVSPGGMTVPEQSVLELQISKQTVNPSTSIVVQAASDSTLPPIISAMEVYSIEDTLQATYSDDVEGLASLKQLWPVLNEWTGDPCLPTPYNWEWVGCSSDDAPRITALNLSGFGLSGQIPEFSNLALTMLQTIDLHNNRLSGPIPQSFGSLPYLKELNLANNNFNGSIPSSLSQNSNIELDVSGNPNLCTSGDSCSGAGSSPRSRTTAASPGKKKSNNTGLLVGITVPVSLVFFIAVGLVAYLHLRRTPAAIPATTGKPNGHGAPSDPHSGEMPATTDGHRRDIEEQMGSELADLMALQAQQHYVTSRSPDMAPESSLLRQQQA